MSLVDCHLDSCSPIVSQLGLHSWNGDRDKISKLISFPFEISSKKSLNLDEPVDDRFVTGYLPFLNRFGLSMLVFRKP